MGKAEKPTFKEAAAAAALAVALVACSMSYAQPMGAKASSVLNRHDCGEELPSAVVEGSALEREQACQGLSKALDFFRAHGFEPGLDQEPITYRFVPELRLGCEKPGCAGQRVAGLYEASSKTVWVTKSSKPWMHSKGRLYFKQPYGAQMYVSVLAHESTHALNKQFYAYAPSAHAQDEYLAYASQLWSMGADLRERVLKGYPLPKYRFDAEGNINDMIHAWEPHGFGAMSYRHFMGEAGGAKMMGRIYSGDFVAPTLE